jgi:hypothetical protein
VGPGQDLHGLGQIAVTGDRPVVVGVSAGKLGQHLGVTRIGLGARGRVPLPVAGGRHRDHRHHHIAGGDQRPHEQAPIGLCGNDHLGRIVGPRRHQVVKAGHALDSLRQTGLR